MRKGGKEKFTTKESLGNTGEGNYNSKGISKWTMTVLKRARDSQLDE